MTTVPAKPDLAEISRFDPATAPKPNLRSILPPVILDGALPVLAFIMLTRAGVSTLYALVAGGVFPAINIARQWVNSRRLDPLGIIVMGFLALGAAASLISGSDFFALTKESALTATFGLLCLGSLFAERPLMFYLTRQFVPDQAWWDGLWQYPGFQAMMRKITAVWGVGYILEATVRVALVIALSPALVVVISPLMMFGVIIGLTVWTRRTLFAARERRLRELQSGSPA